MKQKTKSLLLLLLILLQFSALSACSLPGRDTAVEDVPSGLQVYYLDVGQADAAVLVCGAHAMMIDGGNAADSDFIYSWLTQNNISHMDAVVCTHAHEDHVGGLSGALQVVDVDAAYAPVTQADNKAFGNFVRYLDQQDVSITVPAVGDTLSFGEARIEFLGPVEQYSDTNNTSLVIKVTYGQTSFLFTGDMEQQAEEDLLQSHTDLSATVLKVGHHGSATATSAEFLQAVQPSYGIISVGADNDYGHPSPQTLERLAQNNVTVYRTDTQGTILCTSDGSTVSFTPQKQVAATAPDAQPAEDAAYIGNRNSHVFHLPSCNSLPMEHNRVALASREAAIDQGYTPCGRCKP